MLQRFSLGLKVLLKMDSQQSYHNKWKIFIAVIGEIFLATIDGSVVNVALPTLQTSLHTSFALVQWVVLAYLLIVSALLLSMGRLGDIFGKKYLYSSGLIIFTLGSLMCGLSSTIWMLILFRAVQALGASIMMALGMAIITENFPPGERGKALGLSGLAVSLGVIVGPTLGGVILQFATWHWIFFINMPVGIIAVALVLHYVPISKGVRGQKFDFAGAALFFFALTSLLIAITQGQEAGYANSLVIALLLVGVILSGVFLWVERHSPYPMIDLHMFRNHIFSMHLISALLVFICGSGITLLLPYYLENAHGFDPSTVGLLMAVFPVAMGAFAPISGALSDRRGTQVISSIGLGVIVLGYLAVSTLAVDTSIIGYILRYLPVGIGAGLFQSPNNSAIMGNVDREHLGVASGLLALTRTIGQTIGVSVLGALWASQVVLHYGSIPVGGVTAAPAIAQVSALRDISLVIVILVGMAFLLSLWALFDEKLQAKREASEKALSA